MISSLIELKTQIKSKLPTMPPSPPSHEVERETLLQLSALIGIATVVHF